MLLRSRAEFANLCDQQSLLCLLFSFLAYFPDHKKRQIRLKELWTVKVEYIKTPCVLTNAYICGINRAITLPYKPALLMSIKSSLPSLWLTPKIRKMVKCFYFQWKIWIPKKFFTPDYNLKFFYLGIYIRSFARKKPSFFSLFITSTHIF